MAACFVLCQVLGRVNDRHESLFQYYTIPISRWDMVAYACDMSPTRATRSSAEVAVDCFRLVNNAHLHLLRFPPSLS